LRLRVLFGLVAIGLWSTVLSGDVSYSVIEYRVLTDLGQVRLTTGFVLDRDVQLRIRNNRDAFERRGIVLVSVESDRRFVRREKIAGHSIETTISLYPPLGYGPGGGLSTAHVVVTVDGRKKIDCPYADNQIQLIDLAILVFDGMIRVRGTHIDKFVDAWADDDKVVDRDWLKRVAR
jgi:hypothetical protein